MNIRKKSILGKKYSHCFVLMPKNTFFPIFKMNHKVVNINTLLVSTTLEDVIKLHQTTTATNLCVSVVANC